MSDPSEAVVTAVGQAVQNVAWLYSAVAGSSSVSHHLRLTLHSRANPDMSLERLLRMLYASWLNTTPHNHYNCSCCGINHGDCCSHSLLQSFAAAAAAWFQHLAPAG